ncbi:MAG: hypothetical protein U0Y68_27595 [Blastocatellia bacterium]
MIASVWNKERLMLRAFPLGAITLLCWFVWHAVTSGAYGYEEWLLFYVIALMCWEPTATWLRQGCHWMPAAELFFLLHLPYYVNPFVSGREEYLNLSAELRTKEGLVIFVFLLFCRLCYQTAGMRGKKTTGLLERELLIVGQRRRFVWIGLMCWFVFNLTLLQSWLPNLAEYFNTVRVIFSSIGVISIFVLFYEMGCRHLTGKAEILLGTLTILTLLISFASGFLIEGTIQAALAFVAFSIGRKKMPVAAMLVLVLILSFLHIGKGRMRVQFWEQGKNYGSVASNPLEIYRVWIAAAWEELLSGRAAEDKTASLLERGNLLQFLSRVVAETPDTLPYLDGTTYQLSLANFVPRFLWPDKPRASAPDEMLAIYYRYQTVESVESTAVGLGRISEAWANFGWLGVAVIGVAMGLLLRIAKQLSHGYSPAHFRFLLATSFIPFALNLEGGFGPAVHAFTQNLFISFIGLWIMSKPLTTVSAPAPVPLPMNAKVSSGVA